MQDFFGGGGKDRVHLHAGGIFAWSHPLLLTPHLFDAFLGGGGGGGPRAPLPLYETLHTTVEPLLMDSLYSGHLCIMDKS